MFVPYHTMQVKLLLKCRKPVKSLFSVICKLGNEFPVRIATLLFSGLLFGHLREALENIVPICAFFFYILIKFIKPTNLDHLSYKCF